MTTNEIEAPSAPLPVSSSSDTYWWTRMLDCVKNRNRVSPDGIAAGNCEFFAVGRGRTLRIVVPKSRGRDSYGRTKNDRPDSIDENFVSRWATRPHPSGNCRCSFRRSFNRKYERSDADGARDDQRGATTEIGGTAMLDNNDNNDDSTSFRLETAIDETINENGRLREKIVKDLEEYIDKLLGQVLTDTIRLFEDADDVTRKPETTEIDGGGFHNRGFVVSVDDDDSLPVPENSNDGKAIIDHFDDDATDGAAARTIENSNGARETTKRNAFASFARKFLFIDRRNDARLSEETRKVSSGTVVDINIDLETVGGEIAETRTIYRKPTLVFLHGFGSSAEAFDNQLEYFSNLGYPCVAPELLGHGMSSAPGCPGDYRFDKLLNDLEIVLEHYAFQPGRKCVIVAHNYGCSFAAALARKYKSNVHQLVLISGGGPIPLAPPSREGPAHCCLRAFLAPFLVCGLGRDVLYSARGRQHPYCGNDGKNVPRPSHMRHVLDGMIWPEGDYVFHRGITAPTLLIHGLRDDRVSLVQECQMERTMIKGFLDAIPTAGHTPMLDCPEQVNHMIHCFVDLWRRKKR